MQSYLLISLGVWTRWSLLWSGSWPQSTGASIIISTHASRSPLIGLLRAMTLTWNAFPASNHLHVASRKSWEVIHLVFECCSSHWSSRLKNAQLVLVEQLWVGEALISLAKMRGAHNLLWHHEVICLSVHSLRTLDCSDSVRRVVWSWGRIDRANTWSSSDHSRSCMASILFNTSWPVWILCWNFWTISLHSDDVAANSHDCLAIGWVVETCGLCTGLNVSAIV